MPSTATFEENDDPNQPDTVVCCSHNILKILIAVLQLLFAITTLYRTQGDQLKLYGYAAFGLTVAPYAWMSFINLLGNMMCPQYDAMFMVKSAGYTDLMTRLENGTDRERKKFKVTGFVGHLTDDGNQILQRCTKQLH